jgi:hypothetical protein
MTSHSPALAAAQQQNSERTAYERIIGRSMAVASFLFSLLYLGSAIFFLANPGVFYPEPYEWMGGNDVEQFSLLWLAWYAGVPAMLGIAWLLKDARPQVAGWAAIFITIGGLTQTGFTLQMLQRAALQRVPFEPYHTMLLIEQSPVYVWALSVLLWMVALALLGIGIWRTDILPRWTGALLVVGTLGFFLYQGPGGLLSPVVPLIGNGVAALCFLLAFPVVGLRLWRNAA